MDISKIEYRNNLQNLIKCHLSENKMITLEQMIKENNKLDYSQLIDFLSKNVVSANVKAYEDYTTLLNLCNSDNIEMWEDLTILSIEFNYWRSQGLC